MKLPTAERRDVPSPIRRLLLTDYYDGPKAGVAVDVDGLVYTFEMLDWDDERGVRVFKVAFAPAVRWDDLRTALRSAAPREWETWVLPMQLPQPAERLLALAEASARPVAIVAATDLMGSFLVWRPFSLAPASEPEPGWLEWLGIPRS